MSVIFSPFAANAATWTGLGDPSRPFRDKDNWDEKAVPAAGSAISVPAGSPDMHIGDDDAAAASSMSLFTMYGDVKLYWEVSTNSCLDAKLVNYGTSRFYKTGAWASLWFNADYENQFDYSSSRYVVAEGKLYLPHYSAAHYSGTFPSPSNFNFGSCVVSNGATLVLAEQSSAPSGSYAGTTSSFSKLISFGIVTNENAALKNVMTFSSTESSPSRIYGPIGGNIRFGGYGYSEIINTNCTYTQFRPMGDIGTAQQGTVGLMKIGRKSETYSSMGKNQNSLCYDWDGVIFKYLGEGETTDKDFAFAVHANYYNDRRNRAPGFDGGPHGGLVFTGSWTTSAECLQTIRLTGTNQVPCVWRGSSSILTKGTTNYAYHVQKDGSGIWRFEAASGRSGPNEIGMCGAVSIEEGVLQFDTLGDVGENCAFGVGGFFFEKRNYGYDPKRESWAFSLGYTNALAAACKEGTLECVGTDIAFSSTRPVSLLGHGRLRSSGSKSLHLRGVSARIPGGHTLTLDGTNELVNVVSEVSDGAEGAAVSVVKTGSCTWSLKGNQTFSGDLVVSNGVLLVNASTNRFNSALRKFTAARICHQENWRFTPPTERGRTRGSNCWTAGAAQPKPFTTK